jgi:hypothetical protein
LNDAVSSKRQQLKKELEGVPASFADVPQEKLLSLCTDFTTVVAEYANGDPDHAELFQRLKVEFRKLKDCLESTKPTFKIISNKSDSTSG